MATGNTPSPFQAADDPEHDFGPWVETASSRASRYRYDYATGDLFVSWRNGIGHVHTAYRGAGSDVYRRFAISASKGKFVNRILNGIPYEPAMPDEIDAPSNPNRRVVKYRED